MPGYTILCPTWFTADEIDFETSSNGQPKKPGYFSSIPATLISGIIKSPEKHSCENLAVNKLNPK